MKFVSINPYTEEVNQEFEGQDFEQCQEAAGRAREAFFEWRRWSLVRRISCLKSLAKRLRRGRKDWAEIITKEMGKPIRQARAEIDKCAWLCDYYAEHSHAHLRDEVIPTDASRSYVTYEPLGVILGIMPWNYPFWQVLRFAVPTLAAGNACLLKHASNVPMAAIAIERLFLDAGFPAGLFRSLLIDAETAGKLISNELVDGVSLTGGLASGSAVGVLAGKGIKKLVLELGGSDPFIVLDDADVAKAAEKAVVARTVNTGQSCIAAKRIIVMESVAESFLKHFLARLRALKMGDPMAEETELGPLARKEFAEELNEQLQDALDRGAKVAYGPSPPGGKGFFFRPAVLTEVTPAMRVMREEVFGPLAPIITVGSDGEAVELANATEFGLGAAVWSSNAARAESLGREIQAGFVAVNSIVKSDPRLPFGGVKKSGVGREMAQYGLREFVNIKTVVVDKPDGLGSD